MRRRKATVRVEELERVRTLAAAIREAGGRNANLVALNVIASPDARYLDHWAHVYRCTGMDETEVMPTLKKVGIIDPES